MKKLLIPILLLMSVTVWGANPPVQVTHYAGRQVVRVKVQKAMRGGSVVVYDEARQRIIGQQILKRNILVFLADAKPGRYTIRVTKDTLVQDYTFERVRYGDLIRD